MSTGTAGFDRPFLTISISSGFRRKCELRSTPVIGDEREGRYGNAAAARRSPPAAGIGTDASELRPSRGIAGGAFGPGFLCLALEDAGREEMTGDDRFKLFGVYVSRPVYEALDDRVYEEAGVVDLADYFDESASSVPTGDPGAEATDELVADLVSEFAALYDAAEFEAVTAVDPDGFELTHLAAKPARVTALRERFEAATTIQEADLRTVHTAILGAYLDVEDVASA